MSCTRSGSAPPSCRHAGVEPPTPCTGCGCSMWNWQCFLAVLPNALLRFPVGLKAGRCCVAHAPLSYPLHNALAHLLPCSTSGWRRRRRRQLLPPPQLRPVAALPHLAPAARRRPPPLARHPRPPPGRHPLHPQQRSLALDVQHRSRRRRRRAVCRRSRQPSLNASAQRPAALPPPPPLSAVAAAAHAPAAGSPSQALRQPAAQAQALHQRAAPARQRRRAPPPQACRQNRSCLWNASAQHPAAPRLPPLSGHAAAAPAPAAGSPLAALRR